MNTGTAYNERQLAAGEAGKGCSRTFTLPAAPAIAFLLLLNLACFAGSFSVGFFCDDFLHLSMLHKAFHGHPELLSLGINSVWQDNGYQLFFRPLVELSLAADYMLWQTNAVGYHLTNFVFQVLSSLCVYEITSLLLRRVDRTQASWAAFIAAALFASYPLHGEVVSWIIGRVDGLCGLLYLTAILLYLKHCQRKKILFLAGSLAGFGAALMCKEMAASIPLVIFLHQAILESPAGSRFGCRVKQALHMVLPYLAVFAIYLLIRAAVLGTVVGGYISSLGETFYTSFWTRLFTMGTLWTFIYPFNIEIVPVSGRLSHALHYLYLLAGVALISRSIFLPWRRDCTALLIFLLATTILTVLPALQVFAISSTLAGNRFAYIPSAPFCILLALVFVPTERPKQLTGRFLNVVLVLLMAAFCICFAFLTERNNHAYLTASAATSAMQRAVGQAVHQNPGKRIVVINSPRDVLGAPMFVALQLFKNSLSPPFVASDLSACVISLDQNYFCSSDLLNVTRLRELTSSQDCRFYFWQPNEMILCPVPETQAAKWHSDHRPHAQPAAIPAAIYEGQQSLSGKMEKIDRFTFRFEPPDHLRDFNFVDVRLAGNRLSPGQLLPGRITLRWDSACLPRFARFDAPYFELNQSSPCTYRFPVGDRKSWYLAESPGKLYVDLPAGLFRPEDVSVRLTDGCNLIPQLLDENRGSVERDDGSHLFAGNTGCLRYDASYVPGCRGALLEVLQPAYKYEDRIGTYRDEQLATSVASRIILKEPRGLITLQAEKYQATRPFQCRLFAIADDGKPLGYCSDPFLFSFSKQLNGSPAVPFR